MRKVSSSRQSGWLCLGGGVIARQTAAHDDPEAAKIKNPVAATPESILPPDYFMAPWEGRITDTEIWNLVNYMKSLSQKK